MDYEPYPAIADEAAPSDAAMAVQRGNAQWAKTFEGGTTNLATRARHAQDITTYNDSLMRQREAFQAQQLRTNKQAQDFYLKSKALDLNAKKQQFEMEDKVRKAEEADKLAPTIFAAKKASTEATLARTAAMAKQAELKSMVDLQAALFQTGIAQAAMDDATDEGYDRAVVAEAMKYPHAIKDPLVAGLVKDARANVTRRQIEAEKAALKATVTLAADEKSAAKADLSAAEGDATRAEREYMAAAGDWRKQKVKADAQVAKTPDVPYVPPAIEADTIKLRNTAEAARAKADSLRSGGTAPSANAPVRMKLIGGKLVPSS